MNNYALLGASNCAQQDLIIKLLMTEGAHLM